MKIWSGGVMFIGVGWQIITYGIGGDYPLYSQVFPDEKMDGREAVGIDARALSV